MRRGALGAAYADGDVIIKQGDVGDCMYVIQTGKVEILHEDPGGPESLAVLGNGDFFGEMAMFEKEVRSATARALGEAKVMKVDKKTLLRRIKEDPLLAVNLLQTMSGRIRRLNDEVARLRKGLS